ncbi:MAG: AI-2E family transporter [Candidatus Kapaibacterium sp.]
MESSTRNTLSAIAVVSIGALSLAFLVGMTGILVGQAGPIILFSGIAFLLWPYRRTFRLVQRLFTLATLVFALWFLSDLGGILLPFGVAFFIAYLADPLVSMLGRHRVPRGLSSLAVVLILLGGIVTVSIYVFPGVLTQMNEVIRRISSMVTSTTEYLESRQFYRWLESFGISQTTARELVQKQVVPELETISQTIVSTVLGALTSLTAIVEQAINVILIPVLTFYFLYDLPQLKTLVRSVLDHRHPRVVRDIRRINDIVRAYIGGQIISAIFVGTMASATFVVCDIPYPVVLGVLCGLLNPIPYLGIIASLFIAIVTILIVNGDTVLLNMVQVTVTVNVLHFLTTYIIDPRVTGSRIGLHPVVLIASLFTFGHFFGFFGLLFSMPAGAVVMMYFNDWRASLVPAVAGGNAVAPQPTDASDDVQP